MIVEALCGLWTKASPLVTPEEELCISSPAFLQLQTEMAVRVAGRHYREQQKKYAGHLSPFLSVVTVNPFTAPVCKMSGLKDHETVSPANSKFLSCNTSTFNAMRLDEDPFTCQCKK